MMLKVRFTLYNNHAILQIKLKQCASFYNTLYIPHKYTNEHIYLLNIHIKPNSKHFEHPSQSHN